MAAAIDALQAFTAKIVVALINPLMLLLAGAAFILFLWGIVKFIMHADDGEARAQGRDAIVWGLVGLVIIFGAYGLINFALGLFNLPAVAPVTGH